jgi:DNA ligase (NAD+)
MKALGISPQGRRPETRAMASGLPLAGKTFVLTGTLHSLSRDDASARIRELGGTATSSVSAKTDFLVVGEEPGSSKTTAAREHNVPTLSEEEFLKMLGGSVSRPPAPKTLDLFDR